PEIPAMPVDRPVFIAGLARTGTTLLHRLLGCEPRLRPLLSWEGLTPAPLPSPPSPDRPDPRIRVAHRSERALRYLAHEFFAIHPVEASGYEEDVLLQDGSFMSPTVDATLPVPTYSAWLHASNQRPMYRYFRRLIQLLLWQRPGVYLGKTPHHLENLPTLLDVFPDAKVIVTHRDPAKVVPSFCSMMAHGRRLFSDDVNLFDVGRQFHAKQRKGVRDAMHARRSLPGEAFLDVHYAELMADPLKEIRRIYDFLGYEPLLETLEAMNAFRTANPKDKRGAHRYRPEDFGLTREQLDADFASYREHYGIVREP
ncbi:MAG: sulfotransferase family protein, partial [Myxococcota bacterium]